MTTGETGSTIMAKIVATQASLRNTEPALPDDVIGIIIEKMMSEWFSSGITVTRNDSVFEGMMWLEEMNLDVLLELQELWELHNEPCPYWWVEVVFIDDYHYDYSDYEYDYYNWC
ncbi:TPA_asm: P7 [Schiedea betacytorhabdovirus 1]|nr:TPA_asm: P7 [Schiedea betacytorhabdovirus 1]